MRDTGEIARLRAEHARMLAFLKTEFSDVERGGRTELLELIRSIDPDWPSPWLEDDEPEEDDGA